MRAGRREGIYPRPVSLNWNGTSERPFIPFLDALLEQPIVGLFADVARCNPGRLAIADRHEQLTYKRCLALVERLAERLRAITPKSGAIGVLLPNCAYYPVATLACLAAGRLLVALDLRYPPDRNSLLIRDARLDALIVVEDPVAAGVDLPPGLPQIDFGRLVLEPDSDAAKQAEFSPAGPDAPAIIIYTSGSQGRPKGVVNSQRSILQRVQHYINAAHINEADHFCPLSSPSTISGVREQMTALLAGATLHVVDPLQAGIREIRGTIRQAGVTMVYTVPALLRTIVQAGDDADDFASLRVLRIGGDRVFWSDIALARQILPTAGLVQIGFSSTESPGLQWFVPPDYPEAGPAVPIGYRLPGVTPDVIDEHGQPTPPGELGELVLRGQSVALGYWLDGQVVPGPFQPTRENSGERSYATGDLVRERSDGLFETGGRKDRQIKVRGQRVEPAELEAALRASPDTLDAVVATDMRPDGTVLVAFLVLRDCASGDALETIKAHVARALPSAMRPAAIHIVEAIPRLPSAKLDMAALSELHRRFGARAADATGEDLPDLAADAGMAKIVRHAWRKVLGRRALTGDPTWIDAGGDSLKLLQFIFVAERILRRTLPVELFGPEMRASEFAAVIALAAPENSGDALTDTRSHVFLMPGVDGDEPILSVFRRELAAELSFTVIKYPALDEMVDGFDFERVVASSCNQVLAGAPAGPLRLAGYSFGGLVCYAVTRRLHAAGREVAFIGIIDARLRQGKDDRATLSYAAQQRRWLLTRASALQNHRRAFGLEDTLCRVAAKLLAQPYTRPALRWIARQPSLPLPSRTSFLLRRRLRFLLRISAARQWQLRLGSDILPLPAVVFRSQGHPDTVADDLGWSQVFERVTVLHFQGDHYSMFERSNRDQLTRAFATVVTSESPQHGAGEPALPALAGMIEAVITPP